MSESTDAPRSFGFTSEGAWIVVGKIASFVAMLAMIRILAEQLEPEQYGRLALGLTLCNLVTQLVMGALGQGIGRYYSVAIDHGGYQDFLKTTANILRTAGLLIVGVGALSVLISVLSGKIEFTLFIASLFLFSYMTGINDISNGLHNLARNRMISVRNSTLELFVRLPIVGFMLWMFHKSAEIVVIGYLISSIIFVYIQKLDVSKLKPNMILSPPMAVDWKSKIIKLSLSASIWGIFVWVQQASDKWMLQIFSSTHDVAQYAIVYQIGYTPMIVGMGVLTAIFTPILYRSNNSNKALINKLLTFVVLITVVGVFLSWILGDFVVMNVASAKYMQAAHYLPHMVLAAGLYSIGDTLCIKLMSDIRVKEIMKIKIASSIIGVVANSVGAAVYGLAGVVYGAIFFGFTYMVMFMVVYLNFSNQKKVVNG